MSSPVTTTAETVFVVDDDEAGRTVCEDCLPLRYAMPPDRSERRGVDVVDPSRQIDCLMILAETRAIAVKARSLSLRSRQVQLALSPKHVAVEVRDPLPTARGGIEIPDRKLDLGRDIRPVELGEFINNVGGCRVA